MATIDGPLELVVECVGGDDLYSPDSMLREACEVKYATKVYYPLCGSHREVPGLARRCAAASSVSEFVDAVSFLAQSMGTLIARSGSSQSRSTVGENSTLI